MEIEEKEGCEMEVEQKEGGEDKPKTNKIKEEMKIDMISNIAINSDMLIELIFTDILEEVVQEKMHEKVQTSIFMRSCNRKDCV